MSPLSSIAAKHLHFGLNCLICNEEVESSIPCDIHFWKWFEIFLRQMQRIELSQSLGIEHSSKPWWYWNCDQYHHLLNGLMLHPMLLYVIDNVVKLPLILILVLWLVIHSCLSRKINPLKILMVTMICSQLSLTFGWSSDWYIWILRLRKMG